MIILYQVHRGVSTEYSDNTMATFRAAEEPGYDWMETDPVVTRDGVVAAMSIRIVCVKTAQ